METLLVSTKKINYRYFEPLFKGPVKVSLTKSAEKNIQRSYQNLSTLLDSETTIYGVNTGFGNLSHIPINASDQNQLRSQSQAKSWFSIHNKDFKLICEQAGTEPEYIIKLYEKLQYNYNSGKITKEQLKFGISRLDKKI